jgi:hypothetical protein
MKIGTEGSEAYFRTNPPCPAFWGVAPPKMKIGTEGSEAYFRTNSHAPPFGGVAPRNMKKGRKLGFYFRINPLSPNHLLWGERSLSPPGPPANRDGGEFYFRSGNSLALKPFRSPPGLARKN